ncbi:hypothetical protein FO520_04435 [Bacillus subtilis]
MFRKTFHHQSPLSGNDTSIVRKMGLKRMECTLIFTKYLCFCASNHTFDLLLGLGESGTI